VQSASAVQVRTPVEGAAQTFSADESVCLTQAWPLLVSQFESLVQVSGQSAADRQVFPA
jgi:hypothetical protein